jgi:hypothetical protein
VAFFTISRLTSAVAEHVDVAQVEQRLVDRL